MYRYDYFIAFFRHGFLVLVCVTVLTALAACGPSPEEQKAEELLVHVRAALDQAYEELSSQGNGPPDLIEVKKHALSLFLENSLEHLAEAQGYSVSYSVKDDTVLISVKGENALVKGEWERPD